MWPHTPMLMFRAGSILAGRTADGYTSFCSVTGKTVVYVCLAFWTMPTSISNMWLPIHHVKDPKAVEKEWRSGGDVCSTSQIGSSYRPRISSRCLLSLSACFWVCVRMTLGRNDCRYRVVLPREILNMSFLCVCCQFRSDWMPLVSQICPLFCHSMINCIDIFFSSPSDSSPPPPPPPPPRFTVWSTGLPQNLHAVFCPLKKALFWTFYVFGSCFRTLAVILV